MGSEAPVSIVMLVRGVVPTEVSSLVNWDSYSFSKVLSSCWMVLDSSWHGGLKVSGVTVSAIIFNITLFV